jgi:hypothetical protein
MTLYLETSGSFAPWAGEAIGDVRHPLSIEQAWSKAQLAAIGLHSAEPADAVPEGKVSTGQVVQLVNGMVKFVHVTKNKPQPTIAERKEDLKTRVRAHGMAIRRGGFEVNFGTDDAPNLQVLQLRDATPENDDEKNWMASLSAYTAAVIAGAGDVQGAKFRPESNDTLMVSYAQAMGILTGLFDWVASLVQTVWWKCDQIDGAHTHAALDALEGTIGQDWPE